MKGLNNILVFLYKIVPNALKQVLGQSKVLRPIRRLLIYNGTQYKTTKVNVSRDYLGYNVEFVISASLQVASKIKYKGIENVLLLNSFKLIKSHKANRNNLSVLDVGANFGYLSAVWAASIAQNGNVTAFEPNKDLFASILSTISSNIKFRNNFKVNNLAVGNKNEEIMLNVSTFSSNTQQMAEKNNTYPVEMVRLDDFLRIQDRDPIDLIKIDVDGIELDILHGAKKTIKRDLPIVIVETNGNMQIIKFFKTLNYEILDMKLSPFTEGELPLNIFCIPK